MPPGLLDVGPVTLYAESDGQPAVFTVSLPLAGRAAIPLVTALNFFNIGPGDHRNQIIMAGTAWSKCSVMIVRALGTRLLIVPRYDIDHDTMTVIVTDYDSNFLVSAQSAPFLYYKLVPQLWTASVQHHIQF